MTAEKPQPQPPSFDDLANAWRHAFQQAADEVKAAWQKINPDLRDVLLGSKAAPDSAPEPVDIATTRDQVVTAALRYAAAKGDAATSSLADTNAALAALDDALAGYVDATGWNGPPTVPAAEALTQRGAEIEFTVRGTVLAGGVVDLLDGHLPVEQVLPTGLLQRIGRDFRVIRKEPEGW